MTSDEEEEVARANAEAARANEAIIRAYQLTFNTASGQEVLQDLMAFGHFRSPIENPTDEGKRQAVLRILNLSMLSLDQIQSVYRGIILPRPA